MIFYLYLGVLALVWKFAYMAGYLKGQQDLTQKIKARMKRKW